MDVHSDLNLPAQDEKQNQIPTPTSYDKAGTRVTSVKLEIPRQRNSWSFRGYVKKGLSSNSP